MEKQELLQYAARKREIVMLETQLRGAGGDGALAQHRQSRKTALELQCAAVEEFLAGVEDSTLRQLLSWRYLEGKTIAESAHLVGYSESQSKRIYHRFFARMTRDELA